MPPKFEAGKGGWPTVRYFNRDTGPDGAPYTQKTSKSMCDELGDNTYMRQYVEEKGVKPCEAATDAMAHCSEKQQAFATTWKAKSAVQRATEHARLTKIGATLSATPELMKWHKQRLNILATLTAKDPKDEF